MKTVTAFVACVLGFLAIMCAIPCEAIAQEFNYAEAIRIAKTADDMIQSVKGELICERSAIDRTTKAYSLMRNEVDDFNKKNSGTSMEIDTGKHREEITYLYDRKSTKLRYNLINKSENRPYAEHAKSYDGEKTTYLTYNVRGDDSINPNAGLMSGDFLDMESTPFCYGFYLFRNPISDVLSTRKITASRLTISNIRYTKTENINGMQADMFVGEDEQGNSYTFWLAKELLYRPVQLKMDYSGIFKITTTLVATISYSYIDKTIPMPDYVTMKTYGNVDGAPQLMSEGSLDYVLEHTKLNVPIEASEFALTIPEGVSVTGLPAN